MVVAFLSLAFEVIQEVIIVVSPFDAFRTAYPYTPALSQLFFTPVTKAKVNILNRSFLASPRHDQSAVSRYRHLSGAC